GIERVDAPDERRPARPGLAARAERFVEIAAAIGLVAVEFHGAFRRDAARAPITTEGRVQDLFGDVSASYSAFRGTFRAEPAHADGRTTARAAISRCRSSSYGIRPEAPD